MKSDYTVLVVDDEIGIQDLVVDALRVAGIDTSRASDGNEALTKIRKNKFNLIVLDLNLPKLDGISLLQKLKQEEIQTPVLILSARGSREDVTTGLRVGADDYLAKPFGIEELVLRVKAIIRRSTTNQIIKNELICGPIRIDLDRYQAYFNDLAVDLSATEFKLLEALISRQGRVVTKENLLSIVWGIDFKNNSTVVETYISYLRRKFHIDGFAGIKTIRGIGFQIVDQI